MLLGGRDITNLPPEGRCQRGLARTFQVPRPFAGLDVLDNVAVGCLARAHSVAHARDLALPVLDLLGIVSHADALAETLPIGLRSLLDRSLRLYQRVGRLEQMVMSRAMMN